MRTPSTGGRNRREFIQWAGFGAGAMVFGMLPLALALNDGGEIQAPMGRAIIGGVITSTLLTLVVVPVLYSYLVKDTVRKDGGSDPSSA